MKKPKFTRTQQKFFDALKPGKPVRRDDLRKLLWDEQGEDKLNSVRMHISNIRQIVRADGYEITARGIDGHPCYTLVRFISEESQSPIPSSLSPPPASPCQPV